MIEYSKEVEEARKNAIPIVALESTIIACGMPFPQNLETAQEVERVIRNEGVTPATIALKNGKIKAGLNEEELQALASANNVVKASSRDLAYLLTTKQTGATTVASTARCAQMAGIHTFVTGGIGGVHRGVGETFDISADLIELSRCNIAIVCAGIKSILDVGKTIEFLETLSIPTFGYQCSSWPLFYTHDSPYNINQIDCIAKVAQIMHCKWEQLQQNGSIIVANPVPKDKQVAHSIIKEYMDEIEVQAQQQKITGKDITPFFLGKMAEKTKGNSLKANISLIVNNAKLGAKIAKEYSEYKKSFCK